MWRWLRDGLLWSFVGLIALHRLRQAYSGSVHGDDLAWVWEAARNLAHGDALYDPDSYLFVYLPSAAVLFLPLDLVPLDTARDVWAVASVVSLILACVVLVRAWNGQSWLAPASAAVMVGSAPALGVFHGNVDLVLPLLVALSVHGVTRGRWTAVGLVSGLSLAVKPLIVAPTVILAWERRWRAVALSLAVPVVLSGPALMLTQQPWTFVTHTLPGLLRGENDRVQMVSVAIASITRDQPLAVQIGARAGVLALALVALALVWRRQAPHAVRWLETVVVAQAALTLLGGFAFTHHATVVLLMLPAAAAPASLTRRLPVVVAVVLFAFPRPPPGSGSFDHAMATQGSITLVLVLAAMAYAAWRSSGRREVTCRRQA